MEGNRQLDLARSSPTRWPLIRFLAIVALLSCLPLPATGQSQTPERDQVAVVKQLFAQEQWPEIVRLVEGVAEPSAELDYYYGIALARLELWSRASQALLAGYRLQPGDERFPVELAGVAFRQKRYPEAARWLRRALRLNPGDAYANNFLGSVYFLEGNLEATLKYWNRVDKPEIATVSLQPEPQVRASLLDTAFAISQASVLSLPDQWTTEARVRGLGIFPRFTFDLNAREDQKFDVVFRAAERNGWGANKWQGLASLFRGVFRQTIYPEYFNLNHSAINIESMVRWDAQKRRFMGSLSGPWKQNAKQRFSVQLDLRNENWDIRPSFTGAAPLLGAVNLRREAVTAGIRSFASGRWDWFTGAEVSHRDFRNVFSGLALTPALLSQGYQLKHLAQLNYQLWRVPERRFTTRVGISSQAGRIWSQTSHSFMKLQGSLVSHWFPQSQGDDYAVKETFRAGKTFGQVPFDELFMLGIEQDNDLWLRAHVGTRDGRKGSAPMGRNYTLSNWELDKNVYSNGLLGVKLGPFVDTGKITDSSPGLGSSKWLWDTGMQAKVRILGIGVTVSYGRDLRSGNGAIYATIGR
jgi:tetratricopeptide (TPR) repeat protein